MRARIFFCLVAATVLFVAVAPGFAQQPEVIHWQDIESLLEEHPDFQIAESELAAAKAEICVARQYPNPEISGSYGRAEALEGDETATIFGVEAEVPIDKPIAWIFDAKAAKAEYRAAGNDAQRTRLDAVLQLRRLFLAAVFAEEKLEALTRSRDQVAQLVETAKRRVESGEASPLEQSRLEIELEKVGADLSAADKYRNAVNRNLDLWLGGKLPDGYRAQTAWTKLPEIPAIDSVASKAKQANPELSATRERVDAADARVKAEWNRLMPSFSVGAFYDEEMDSKSVGGMATVEVPLWNWNQGGIKKARAERNAARHKLVREQRSLSAEINRLHAETAQLIERAQRYYDNILPRAKQNFTAQEKRYQIGETDVMDLLDAGRELVEIETEMQDIFFESWVTYYELMTLMGGNDA